MFERLLYNSIFAFFTENDLILAKQSVVRPGDSCTDQLLSIAHEILSAFADGHEVKGVFLDISKRLIEFGMKACFSSYDKTGYRES